MEEAVDTQRESSGQAPMAAVGDVSNCGDSDRELRGGNGTISESAAEAMGTVLVLGQCLSRNANICCLSFSEPVGELEMSTGLLHYRGSAASAV
jgi:hypothetical protein